MGGGGGGTHPGFDRVPTPQGKHKNSLSGKHREFGNCAKTQGIFFIFFLGGGGSLTLVLTGYPRHRENKKIPCQENIGNLEICQKTGNLFCSSRKFPYSKDKRCFDIFGENFLFF